MPPPKKVKKVQAATSLSDMASVGDRTLAQVAKPLVKNLYKEHPKVAQMSAQARSAPRPAPSAPAERAAAVALASPSPPPPTSLKSLATRTREKGIIYHHPVHWGYHVWLSPGDLLP